MADEGLGQVELSFVPREGTPGLACLLLRKGEERDRSLATSFRSARQKHAYSEMSSPAQLTPQLFTGPPPTHPTAHPRT